MKAVEKPSLYGINYSNRDFTQAETWGKNQFNSSFPAGLVNFLASRRLDNIYISVDKSLSIVHSKISAKKLYGLEYDSEDLFYSFESPYVPYQQLVIGNLPRVDLVTQSKSNGQCLRPIEIKLTALPDNSTCNLTNEYYGSELVIRPDTIVYLACSIVEKFKDKRKELHQIIGEDFDNIIDWTEGNNLWEYIPKMIRILDKIIL